MLRGFHKLCDKGLWDEARTLFRDKSENANGAKESALQPRGIGGWTALHIACKRDPPADVVKTLCTFSPVPAETFDLYNKLPIHYAAQYGASVDVIKALIEYCPQCLSGVDEDGLTPLHLSIKYSIQDPATLVDPVRGFPSLEEVEVLLGRDSSVLWTADKNEYIPLHYAVSNIDKCSFHVLEKLINADVNTVVAQTKDGMTPLQLAIRMSTERKITVPLVKLLLGVSSDGKEWIDDEFEVTRMLSSSDMLPLHFACQNHEAVPFETLELLLERCPTAAAAESLEGFPLELLEAQRRNIKDRVELVEFNDKSDFLFAYNQNILPYRTEMSRLKRFEDRINSELSGRNPSLSEETKAIWTWMCTFPEEDDKEALYPNFVEDILESVADAGSAKMLACLQTTTKNGENMPLYRIASPTVAQVFSPFLRFCNRYEFNPGEINKSESSLVLKAKDCTYSEGDDRRNVIINFYSNRNDFSQEADMYQNLEKMANLQGLPSPTISIIQTFDVDRMGTSLETGDDGVFIRDITQFNGIYSDLSGYSYAIVRGASEGEISSISRYDDVDKKYHIDNKTQIKDIAESMQCLHSNNYFLGGMEAGDFVQSHGSVKLRNVKSIVEVDSNSTLAKKFYGLASLDLGISNLPPEMIAKLNIEEVEKYLMYWNREFNDFHIANEHTPDNVKCSPKVQAFLEKEECSFEEFWARVQQNAALWKRIQPRQVGDYYYVAKCYRPGVNGGVSFPEKLPYELVPYSTGLDIWFFGTLIYELITGETLLHGNKTRNIVNDNDFERLFNWTMTDQSASSRLYAIADPLARDLIRSMLTSSSQRQQTMETVLKHPIFCNTEEVMISEVCNEIIQEEKESARKFKSEQFLTLKKSTLDKRTENLPLVSLDAQLRFEISQWKLLQSTYDLSEVTFPTSCVVLPYELEKDFAGVLRTPMRNTNLSCKLGLVVADILHYLTLVSDIKKIWGGESFASKIQDYIGMNRNATSAPEDNLIRICEGVIRKANNASAIVKDVTTSYVTSGDVSAVASKLISDTLRDIVDLDVCKRIVSSSETAQNSIASLLGTVGEYTEKTAENMMNEQMKEIIGVEFTETSFAKKESVQNALMDIIQRYCENPLAVMEGLLEARICELIDIYTEMEVCYVYLVDEYSGAPVASGIYPCQLDFSLNVAKTLIAPTILAMRCNFPVGILPLLGLTLESIPPEWAKLSEFQLPSGKSNSADEISTLQAALGINPGYGILPLLERFFAKKEPEEEFAGLIRLRSPNGLIMWVTQESREEALAQAGEALVELQKSNTIADKDKIAATGRNKAKKSFNSLWRKKNVYAPSAQSEVRQPAHTHLEPRRPVEKKDSMKNEIQSKLDMLKNRKSEKRAEPAPTTEQQSIKPEGYKTKVMDEQELQRSESLQNELNHRTLVPFESMRHDEPIDGNFVTEEVSVMLDDVEKTIEKQKNEDLAEGGGGGSVQIVSVASGKEEDPWTPAESTNEVESDQLVISEEVRSYHKPNGSRMLRASQSIEARDNAADDLISTVSSHTGSRMPTRLRPMTSQVGNREDNNRPKTSQGSSREDNNRPRLLSSSIAFTPHKVGHNKRLSPNDNGDSPVNYTRAPRRILRPEVSE